MLRRLILLALLPAVLAAQPAAGEDVWDVHVNLRNGFDLARDGRYVYLATGGGVLRLDTQTSALVPILPLNGLASVDVRAVAVDRRGNKWFGHGDPDLGVSVLDSAGAWSLVSSFEGLQLGAGKRVKTIRALGDSIWIGTESGATLFEGGARAIILSQEKEGIVSDDINAIALRGREVWLGTALGLSVYSAGTVRNYTPASDSILPTPEVLCLEVDSDGIVWAGTPRGVIQVVDGEIERPIEYELFNSRRVRSIAFEDSAGTDVPWFATDNGPYRRLLRKARRESGADMGNPEAAWKIEVDDTGLIWLANNERWMFRWVPSADGWREFTQSGTIPFNHIGDVAVDKRGFVWCPLVGNVEGSGNSPGSRMLIYDALTWGAVGRTALPDSYAAVASVAIDSSGNRWFGVRAGGVLPRGTLLKIDASVGTVVGPEDIEYFPVESPYFFENQRIVNNVEIGPDGRKLLAMWEEGFAVLDSAEDSGELGTWSIEDPPDGPVCLARESGILQSSAIDAAGAPDGRVWYALQRSYGGWIDPGEDVASRSDDRCAGFTQQNSPMPVNQFTVRVDRQGKVWYGSEGGLSRYDPSTAAWRTYTESNTGGGLPDNRVRAIAFDSRGNTWAGTFGGGLGLLLSDGETWLEPYTVESNQRRGSGLTTNDITSLFCRVNDEDEEELWIGTWGGGLIRFVKDWTVIQPPEDGDEMLPVTAYPNPFREGDADAGIAFANVPIGSTIEIYSLAGDRIRTIDGPASEEAPDPAWDLLNERSVVVAGGVYLFLVKSGGDVLHSGKIAYLR